MSQNAKKPRTNAEQAAIVLLSLGVERAGAVLAGLPRADAAAVAAALSQLGRVDASELTAALAAFEQTFGRASKGDADRADLARKLVTRALGADAAAQLPDVASEGIRKILANFDAKALAQFISLEHPQTAALLLAHAHAAHAGKTLKLLPPALQTEVIRRIAQLEPVAAETLAALEDALRDAQVRAAATARPKRGGAAHVAAMLNTLSSSDATRALADLGLQNPDLAAELKAAMLTFEDLARLDTRALQTLLARTSEQELVLALKNVSPSLEEALLQGVSERKRKAVREAVAELGKVRKTDVEAAQKAIAARAQALLDEGLGELAS